MSTKPKGQASRTRLLRDVEFNKKYAWMKVELLEGNYSLHSQYTIGDLPVYVYRIGTQKGGKFHFFKTNIKLHV